MFWFWPPCFIGPIWTSPMRTELLANLLDKCWIVETSGSCRTITSPPMSLSKVWVVIVCCLAQGLCVTPAQDCLDSVWLNRSLISKVLGKYLELGGGLGAGCGYSLRVWTWWVLFIKDFGLKPKISSSQTLQCRLISEPLAVWNILIVILGGLNRQRQDSKLMFSFNRNPEEILFLWNHAPLSGQGIRKTWS